MTMRSNLSTDQEKALKDIKAIHRAFHAETVRHQYERLNPAFIQDRKGVIYVRQDYHNVQAEYVAWLLRLFDSAALRLRAFPSDAVRASRSVVSLGILKPSDIYTSLVLESGFDATESQELLFNI